MSYYYYYYLLLLLLLFIYLFISSKTAVIDYIQHKGNTK